MQQPFNVAFNVAVNHIASKLFPCGFDVAPDAIDADLPGITAQFANGRAVVSSLFSDNTIFACPETNYAFRAWHDWCHVKGQHPFTLEGEAAVARMQIEHIRALYGEGDFLDKAAALIRAEVIGQAAYKAATGDFPVDQRAFVREMLRWNLPADTGAYLAAGAVASGIACE